MSSTASDTEASILAGIEAAAGSVEVYMREYLDERPLASNLAEGVRYGLLGGGKRLRPALSLMSCAAVGGDERAAMPPAAAIEMIHCFSLVHDDLPAMDDDDLRRGRPTLHKHTSEAMAILAGDAMVSLAFELIASRVAPATLACRLTLELAGATNDMISGQVYDSLPEVGQFTLGTSEVDRLGEIHRHKTGALIRCACRMGALAGGGGDAELLAVTRYAEAIGLMFQVVDDLLDVTQTTQNLGKTANKDAEQGKLTYPGLLGVERSREEVQRLRGAAHDALTPLGGRAEPLHELCDYMAVRQR